MRDVRVVEGETATLTCVFTRVNDEIQWLKNLRPILGNENRFSQNINEKSVSLIVKDTQLDDDAEYTVTCGEAKCSAHLYVEGNLIEISFLPQTVMRI